MLMRSRRQFQIRAVTAGTARLTALLPNNRFRTLDVVILGVNHYARAGHQEDLGWPPQTVLAEYGPAFTSREGTLGYAKPIAMQGHLMQVNLINSQSDHIFASRQQSKFIGTEISLFKKWLNTSDHPHRSDWPQQVRDLSHSMDAFGNHKLTFGELLAQFSHAFNQGSAHQSQRTDIWVEKARAIRDRITDESNARLPIAYLLINVQNVTHFLYGDDRDIQFNTDQDDAAHRKAGDLQRVMFTRVQQQKAQFEKLGIPFYQPERLARMRAREQPVWDPKQLDALHLGG